jgi:hypothetical protein
MARFQSKVYLLPAEVDLSIWGQAITRFFAGQSGHGDNLKSVVT